MTLPSRCSDEDLCGTFWQTGHFLFSGVHVFHHPLARCDFSGPLRHQLFTLLLSERPWCRGSRRAGGRAPPWPCWQASDLHRPPRPTCRTPAEPDSLFTPTSNSWCLTSRLTCSRATRWTKIFATPAQISIRSSSSSLSPLIPLQFSALSLSLSLSACFKGCNSLWGANRSARNVFRRSQQLQRRCAMTRLPRASFGAAGWGRGMVGGLELLVGRQ